MRALLYTKKIPVKYSVDIFIAGAGPSGVAAAIVAAREGKKVYLAEAHTCIGGLGTAGLVPVFMRFTDGINFLAGGIGKEILTTLQKSGGTFPPDGLCIKAEVLKRVYETMLEGSKVHFTYHTKLIDVIVKNGIVSEAICDGKSGLFAVRAKVFIDGTGDGDLAYFSGADYEKGDKDGLMMPGTLCSLWAGIDWKKVEKSKMPEASRLKDAFRDGVFTIKDRHLPGMFRVGEITGGGNIGHTFGVDGTDEESLTKAYIWGRKLMIEYEKYYKKYLKGFEKMELVATASLMGIRESRRIKGDYVLNLEDFKSRAVFDDEIGRYSYPVDIHSSKPDKKSYAQFLKEYSSYRLGKGESYGIPYRILTPVGLKNVLVCGRCVSTDRYLQSSIRVMPGCYITGQAAGMAAAIMVEDKKDSRSINIRKLQKKLKRIGAYLPYFNKG
ncbi:MAG TPA: FAD-dependent oxidoreductase [bacterium]|nr:FAD-dependent oxidoreductase [bacterium]HPP29513.1 FAD-dependent oxidoreductase [bacterium]